MSKKKKIEQEKQEPTRILGLMKLIDGEVIHRESIGAFDVIIAENIAILSAPKGSFIYYSGTSEYEILRVIANELMTFSTDEVNGIKEAVCLLAQMHWFQIENPEFANKSLLSFIDEVNIQLEAAEKMTNTWTEEEATSYLREEKMQDMVMSMIAEANKGNESVVKPTKGKKPKK